ncbi:MAG: glycosyltransferase family 1 protein, partial [Chitinophagaceae bacterium]
MDIICLCHLRWDFVFQRPQHLLSRFAKNNRVYFIEEPIFGAPVTRLAAESRMDGTIVVLTCHIGENAPPIEHQSIQEDLLNDFISEAKVSDFILWYYTPMAMELAGALPEPALIVYDCMDELSAFRFAPPDIQERELHLLAVADLVFTGGHSLYEAKKHLHGNIHFFPSSIDKAHFGKARTAEPPANYAMIGKPRIGFFGVIDERFDVDLISALAASRPDWHFIIIGPVVKIDASILPRASNLHYPGSQPYEVLPSHLSGWDVALIPFAINESTAFISPTKTPEYL